MSIPITEYRGQINSETLKLLDFLQEELSIPPMLACLQIGGFCFSNVLAYYKSKGIEPPEALVKLIETDYPTMLADLNDTIEMQYLMINTQGTT